MYLDKYKIEQIVPNSTGLWLVKDMGEKYRRKTWLVLGGR